jgi:hypothetical protein
VASICIAVLYPGKDGSDRALGVLITMVVMIGVLALFIYSKLEVIIDTEAIYYRYPPFVNKEKKLTKNDIKEAFVRQYQPIWEYGGWGYRVRPGSKALNVAGDQGLQLVLSNGKKLLLGTQRPSELTFAVKKLKENWEMNG